MPNIKKTTNLFWIFYQNKIDPTFDYLEVIVCISSKKLTVLLTFWQSTKMSVLIISLGIALISVVNDLPAYLFHPVKYFVLISDYVCIDTWASICLEDWGSEVKN